MEMVAKLSGLSKSGLYAHFKSKRDMLSKLFMTEFERIAEAVDKRSGFSERQEERLYLALISIAEYLLVRPEILVIMDWVRIQRLELDLSVPEALYIFFTNLKPGGVEGMPDGGASSAAPEVKPDENSQWILSLLIFILMFHLRADGAEKKLTKRSFRKLYRFITLGIEGYEENED
jgi:AcrR family transcriptional regulator